MRNRKKTLFLMFSLYRLLFCVHFSFWTKCAISHHWVHLYPATPTLFWTRNCPGIRMTRQKPNLWINNNQNTTVHCCKKKVNVNLCTAGSNVGFPILDITKKNRTKFADKLKAWIVTRKKLFWRMLEKLETSTKANFFWEEKTTFFIKKFFEFLKNKDSFFAKKQPTLLL